LRKGFRKTYISFQSKPLKEVVLMGKNVCCESSDLVKIAGVIGGLLFVIIIMFLVLAKELMASVMGTVVWGFVVLGIVLGVLSTKKKK
jgi:hypothetical protein